MIAFLVGIMILVSLVGLGAVLSAVLLGRRSVDWAQQACWGASLAIAIGGVLDLCHAISRSAVLAILYAGLLAGLGKISYHLYMRFRRKDWLPAILRGNRKVGVACAVLVALVLFQCAAWGAFAHDKFNIVDDLSAYLVYPQKMLQAGCLGPDPYSYRRLISSLGGHAFLQTFVLSFLEEQNLHLLDPGVALLILAGLLLAESRQRGFSPAATLLMLLPVAFLDPPIVNVTGMIIGTVFLVSLYRMLNWSAEGKLPPVGLGVLVGIQIAAVCCTKSTFIVPTALFAAIFYVARLARAPGRSRVTVEMAVALACTLGAMAPWMIGLHASSGTYLYPLLGKGFVGSQYGGYDEPWGSLSWTTVFPEVLLPIFLNPLFASMVVLALVAAFLRGNAADADAASGPADVRPSRGPRRLAKKDLPSGGGGQSPAIAVAAMVVAVGIGTCAMSFSTAGYGMARFSYPFLLATLFALFFYLLQDAKREARASARVMAALLVIGGLVGLGFDKTVLMERGFARMAWTGSRSTQRPGEEPSRVRAMQQAVPAGQTIFARLERPYLLDFSRNPVFIVDEPGGASLPPGMPFFAGPEALADYLAKRSIRYVAYTYKDERCFPRAFFGWQMIPGSTDPWVVCMVQHAFDFQDNLLKLGQKRKLIYDDGDTFVADLTQRAVELEPDSAGAYRNRGIVFEQAGRPDAALKDFDKAIELEPKNPDNYSDRGVVYFNGHQYEAAIRDFSAAIALKPDYARAFKNRGTAYVGASKYDLALKDFDKAIELNPGHAEDYCDRAAAQYWLKAYDAAWEDIKTCRKLGGTPNAELVDLLTKASGRSE